MRPLYALAVLLAGAPAVAETLTGTLAPSLRGRADLVYLEHVDDAPPGDGTAVLRHHASSFSPTVLPLVLGATVAFQSDDPELHVVRITDPDGVVAERTLVPSHEFRRTPRRLGVYALACAVHPSMRGWIVVLQNPHFTRPEPRSGHWVLRGVKPGTYTLRVWGASLRPEENEARTVVTVGQSREEGGSIRVATR